MAQPNPTPSQTNSKPAESKPTLRSVETTPARSGSDASSGSSKGLWIVGALALLLGLFSMWQGEQLTAANERIAALEDRVLGLDTQLIAAQTQISTYEMQRGLVRDAVTDISDRMNALREMVGAGPAIPSALAATPVVTEPEAAAEPAPEAVAPTVEEAPAE